MTLILLFLPHHALPNLQTLTTSTISSIESAVPSLDIKILSPSLSSSNITSPSLKMVENVVGVFNNTTTTYNEPTVTYNSATQTYGGQDRVQPIKSVLYSIDLINPTIYSIEKN